MGNLLFSKKLSNLVKILKKSFCYVIVHNLVKNEVFWAL
jgi:hypothetical protein